MRVLDEEIPCPLCKQIINIYGDHATCCTKSGDLIIRHNALRNMVEEFASDGMLSPVLEKEGILGNTTGRRPGDVTIQRWAEGKGLASDVAVTSPLAATYERMKEPCEWYAATHAEAWQVVMRALWELIISLVRWCLKHLARSTPKEKKS